MRYKPYLPNRFCGIELKLIIIFKLLSVLKFKTSIIVLPLKNISKKLNKKIYLNWSPPLTINRVYKLLQLSFYKLNELYLHVSNEYLISKVLRFVQMNCLLQLAMLPHSLFLNHWFFLFVSFPYSHLMMGYIKWILYSILTNMNKNLPL